jgi:hypothetical protein
MKQIKCFAALLFFVSIILSCKKFLDVDPPIDMLTSETVFNDEQTAISAIVGMYTSMMMTSPIITSGAVTVYTGLASDEFYSSDVLNTNLQEFANNAISPYNSAIQESFWFRGFNVIYHANACIKGLENNVHISAPLRDQLLGEALFTRAFVYYYFVNLFGDVPLLLRTDYEENAQTPRTQSDSVYAQIITDLKQAENLLDTSYPTAQRVRPNKWTAAALLARVYLALQQWDLAEQESSSVINSGTYSLEQNLNNVFLASSSEAIWQIMPVEQGFNTTEGLTFVPYSWSSMPPSFPLTNYLLNSFEENDSRKIEWVGTVSVDGTTYYYPFKYKINDYGLPVTEYYVAFRLAEQYLIRSECFAHLGENDESKNDLNVIRERAGLPLTDANSSDDLLNAIAHERRIELFAEWGNRWFDLKRTQNSSKVLAPLKPDWQPADTLFPIPSGEILKNSSLTQNLGY